MSLLSFEKRERERDRDRERETDRAGLLVSKTVILQRSPNDDRPPFDCLVKWSKAEES